MNEITSRPINWLRTNAHPAYQAALALIMSELAEREARTRGRGAAHADFESTVSALILDLHAAQLSDPNMTIGISKANATYVTPSIYRPTFLSWTIFRDAFEGLRRCGYLHTVTKGSHNRGNGTGRVTRIAGTAKLARGFASCADAISAATVFDLSAMQGVILRDKNKREIEYPDDNMVVAMRTNLRTINALFQHSWFDVRIPDDEFNEMNRRMGSRNATSDEQNLDPGYQPPVHVDFSRRSVVRIFNDGDWSKGGRFYGGWWQSVPKRYRPFITIDGKQTVELDFSHLHPALLHAREGLVLEGDAYQIGLPSVPRNVVKRAFNAMVNAGDRLNPIDGFDSARFGISWNELQDQIANRHQPIRLYFKSQYGLHLQRNDADLAECWFPPRTEPVRRIISIEN